MSIKRTWDHVHHGSFNLEEAHLVKVAAHVGNNLGAHLPRVQNVEALSCSAEIRNMVRMLLFNMVPS